MSYDITLVPIRPGQSWDEAIDESTDVEVDDRSELLQTWTRIEARLRDVLTGEIDVVTSSPDSNMPTVGELTVMDNGLQVALYPGQASVSFPYWGQEDPQDFHRQVAEAVRIVAEETGYAAYDGQTDAEFDGSFDDETGLAFTRQLREGTAPGQGPDALDRPFYSGRRRAGTYLVIGAVVTVAAVWLLASGNGGTLSWVALAIGIVDLLVGAAAWRSSGRPRRRVTP